MFELRKDNLVRSGRANYSAPMDKDLATLKSLIQTIVRDEIKRNQIVKMLEQKRKEKLRGLVHKVLIRAFRRAEKYFSN